MQINTVSILGDGQMGLVMANILAGAPGRPAVRLWGFDTQAVASLAQTRRSPRLPEFELPEGIAVTDRLDAALDGTDDGASLVLIAVPTQFISGVLTGAPVLGNAPPFVSVSKGIEVESMRRPTEVVRDARAFGGAPGCVLSGPTIASELERCLPATMVAASEDADLAETVQQLFTTRWLRVYTSDDPLGVELAGATKNVIAIAAGIIDGLKAGFNAKSALLARGLAEITRLGVAMGAQADTFFGLAGAGDLATTCFSPEGRNRSCGEALGRGEPLAEYLARSESVVEGVETSKAVLALASQHNVEMPITEAVHAVLHEGLDPIEGITRLMSRDPKPERVG